MTMTNLAEVLKFFISWEEHLTQYYKHLQKCLVNERSKTAVTMLRDQQTEILKILKTINAKEYESAKFTQQLADYRDDDIIASLQMNRSCPLPKFLEKVLVCEEKMEDYYAEVRSILISRKSKELFDLLIQLKVGQIRQIKELVNCYDMVV